MDTWSKYELEKLLTFIKKSNPSVSTSGTKETMIKRLSKIQNVDEYIKAMKVEQETEAAKLENEIANKNKEICNEYVTFINDFLNYKKNGSNHADLYDIIIKHKYKVNIGSNGLVNNLSLAKQYFPTLKTSNKHQFMFETFVYQSIFNSIYMVEIYGNNPEVLYEMIQKI